MSYRHVSTLRKTCILLFHYLRYYFQLVIVPLTKVTASIVKFKLGTGFVRVTKNRESHRI